MDIAIIIVLTIIGFITFVVLVTILSVRLKFPGQLASIEQLKNDIQRVGNKQSHEVIAQVTKWNQAIASAKKYRTLWWAKIFFASGWEHINEIKIPIWENDSNKS
ncbi:MAG: hypothetical protein ABIK92_15405 [Pseudomonadota bacterium]